MPKSLKQKLVEKGWSSEEIEKTLKALENKKRTKSFQVLHPRWKKFVYYFLLVFLIVINLGVGGLFIFFLMYINSKVIMYITVALIAYIIGALFNLILKDIEHIDQEHYIVSGIFIPIIGLITMIIMWKFEKIVAKIGRPQMTYDIYLICALYFVFLLLPYLIYKIKDVRETRKEEVSLVRG